MATATRSNPLPIYSGATRLREVLPALLILASLLWLLRYPSSQLGLTYYDDGETLYHTLSLLRGKIPYLEDFSHHFLGYVLPFFFAAKLKGFSLELIREVAFATQLLTGLGVFLCARIFRSYWPSILAAAIAISITQPWVFGFYVQYQINLFTVVVLYFSLRYCLSTSRQFLLCAFLFAGIAFTFDQRAIFLSFIPLCTVLLERLSLKKTSSLLVQGALLTCTAPIAAILYLYFNGAFSHFIEQTFIYPRYYRISSLNFSELIWNALLIHKQLILDAPVACTTALVGFLALIRYHKELSQNFTSSIRHERAFKLLIWTALPLAIMPSLGGRDFPNYVVTWFPYLGILSMLGSYFFLNVSHKYRVILQTLPLLAIIISVVVALSHWNQASYEGDGRREVVEYLSKTLTPSDTLYVWAYRLDIYSELQRLSAYPMVNRLMIHPDHKIISEQDRKRHVYPPYEKRFLTQLETKPPNYVVTFDRDAISNDSLANERMLRLLREDYDVVFSTNKIDFQNSRTTFQVHRRRVRTSSSISRLAIEPLPQEG